MIDISIVIPIYNCEDSIIDCLNSVVNQIQFDSYEIILINDSSTDSSYKKVCHFINEHPEIQLSLYSNKENKGPGYSRNIGIKKAVGNFICFCDADDRYDPYFLKYMYSTIVSACKDIVYCGYNICTSKHGTIIHYEKRWHYPDRFNKIIDAYLQSKMHFSHAGAIYRRSFIVENNLFYDESCCCGEDIEFICNILLSNPLCGYVNKSLYYYNASSSSITETMNTKKIIDSLNALDRILKKINSTNLKLKFIIGRYASLSYHSLEISYVQKFKMDIPFSIRYRLIMLSIIYIIRKKRLFYQETYKILSYSIFQ
ncbi:MAG: glycosyltransferase [Dysgonamonadaceae bacterium]|jgi:UDP-glucose:(glucosyl)LPS beta-1,3-glucosyltransferase|nr:glycosyltransferase [Dysgonamonadaceae bacterium]